MASNQNAIGSVVALGLLGLLAYMFRSQLSKLFGKKPGTSTAGTATGAPTVLIPNSGGTPNSYSLVPLLPLLGESSGGFGVPPAQYDPLSLDTLGVSTQAQNDGSGVFISDSGGAQSLGGK